MLIKSKNPIFSNNLTEDEKLRAYSQYLDEKVEKLHNLNEKKPAAKRNINTNI